MKESWHAVTIEVPVEDVEMASHLFHEAGCNGVIEEGCELKAYFRADVSQSDLRAKLKELFRTFSSLSGTNFDIVTSAQNDWRESWRQWFKPFEIVPGIVVAPSWEKYQPKSGEKVITLDPGMAFGTGLHETTKLCAEAIYKNARSSSLLDVGTGSGLLAIVARKFGFKNIACVENDPDAVAVAKENFEINDCCDIKVAASLEEISGKYDLIVANILLLTLIELKTKLIARLAEGGSLILSGITNDQEEKLKNSFSPPLTLKNATHMGEWSCMTFINNQNNATIFHR